MISSNCFLEVSKVSIKHLMCKNAMRGIFSLIELYKRGRRESSIEICSQFLSASFIPRNNKNIASAKSISGFFPSPRSVVARMLAQHLCKVRMMRLLRNNLFAVSLGAHPPLKAVCYQVIYRLH